MTVNESIPRDILRLIVWYPLRWLVLILPARGGIALLRRLGDIHFRLSRSARNHLRDNLKRMGFTSKLDLYARTYLRNHYIDHLFIFIFPKLHKRHVEKLVEIEGVEHLDTAREQGKGVVLVHGHFGPVHLPLVSLARLGYPMKQIGNPSDEGLSWVGRNVAFRLRLHYESKIPAQKIGKYHRFDLFDQPVDLPVGPARLARKTGAALVPMFIQPGRGGFLYRIVIEPPIKTENSGDAAEVNATTEFLDRYKRHIQTCPGYMHFLDRFEPGRMITSDKTNPSNKGQSQP
jgi:lauroyl/myristoyl acyltransferase